MRRVMTASVGALVGLAVGALGGLSGCEDPVPGPDFVLPPSQCAIAVVSSDYRSTSVSLLAADGRVCVRDLVHSGTRPPGLLTALSGDVAVPSRPIGSAVGADPALLLIDRYPNGIITLLDPAARRDDAQVQAQYAVVSGFPGNPQDVVTLGDGSAIVSRLDRNPDDADDGSDLLVVDLADGRAVDRIDLGPAAAPGFEAKPTLMARAPDGRLWVGMAHMTGDFAQAGPGRVAVVDPIAREVVTSVTIENGDVTNCADIALAPGGLWVVCSGKFSRGDVPQVSRSALAFIDTSSATVAWSAPASDLGDAPLGLFSLAALDDTRALVVAVGELGDGSDARPDRLILVDRVAHSSRDLAYSPRVLLEAPAFQIGSLLPSPDAGVVLVAVADDHAPRIAVLGLADLAPRGDIVDVSATGLPPRQFAFFR